MSIVPNLDTMTDEEKLAALESIQQSIRESKELQKQKVAKNVDLVVQALKKIESDIRTRFEGVGAQLEKRISNIKDGRDGIDGRDGKDGEPGRPGKDGKDGRPGRDGKDGVNGVDGQDGISVTNVFLDFDNSLVIELSDGRQINAGEVLPPDISDRLKVIINQGASGGGGGGASLPDQTGNSGKFLTTDGTNASWGTPAGAGDVVGPASATDNAIARFDTTTGKLIQNSVVTVSDAGAISGVASLGVANYVDFNTSPTVSNAAGRMYWDAAQNSLAVGLTSTLATNVGQTLYARATNAEASTISKGQVVYAFGATGNRLSVKLASNTADSTSAKTIGVAAENITAGSTGMIICQGVLDGLNLSAYADGDSIYLGATAGSITATKPYAPNHLVYVGTVERANAGNGQLYVRIQNGYELDELHNVSAQSPSNGQVLIYNASTSLWEKNTLTAGTGITVTNGAGSITIAASGGSGSGDVVGPASSTDNAVARFDGTTGKLVQNSSFVVNDSGEVTTGVWKGTEITVPYGGTGVATLTGIVKGNGSSAFSAAVAGTDYLAPPSGTAILKANSGGALANAVAGTDYVTPTGSETLTNKTIAFGNNTLSDVASLSTTQTFTGAKTFRTTSGTRFEEASGQDAIIIDGRAGGTGSFAVTLSTATLASNTTLTLPNVTDTVTANAATQTLTNKRVTPRVSTTTSSATPTINTDNVDFYGLTAQAVDITSFTTNLSGTPTDGQRLWIYIVGTAARAITWGASFEASTVALPTTTVSTNRLDVGFVWNAATSKWRCVATA